MATDDVTSRQSAKNEHQQHNVCVTYVALQSLLFLYNWQDKQHDID